MQFFESLPFAIKAWCQRDASFFVSPTTCAQWKKALSDLSSSGDLLPSSSGDLLPSSSGLTGGPSSHSLFNHISPETVELAKFVQAENIPACDQALFYPELIKAQRLSPTDIENLITAHPSIKRGVLLSALKAHRPINWHQYSHDPEVNDIAFVARACRGEAVLDHIKQQMNQDDLSLHAASVWWLIQPDALPLILAKLSDPANKMMLCVYAGDLNAFSQHAHHLMTCNLEIARQLVNALLNIHPEVRPGLNEAGKEQPLMIDVQRLRKIIEYQYNSAQPTLWGEMRSPERIDLIAQSGGGALSQFCQIQQVVNNAHH